MLDPALPLVALGAAGLTPSAVILGLRNRDAKRWSSELVPYRLEVSSNFEPSELQQFLGSLMGLMPTRFERPVSVRGIGLEVLSTPDGISYFLLVPRHQTDIVLGQLRGSVPSARVTLEADYHPATPTLAGELATAQPNHQLKVDHPELVAAGILASLQPLDDGEQILLQYLMLPIGRTESSSTTTIETIVRAAFSKNAPTVSQPPRAVLDKQRLPQFSASVRLGVTTSSTARDRQLLGRVTASFHNANSADAHLRRRQLPSRQTVRSMIARRPPVFAHPCSLSTSELSGILALPPGGISLPGLRTTGCRQLFPSSDIPSTGRIVADSNFPGLSRPLAQSVTASQMHTHYLGPSGVGKSSAMGGVAIQDMEAGHCLIVVDPKRDLIEDLLDRVPLHRQNDVIVLDPLDDRPVGLNILQSSDDPALVAEQVFSILHKLNRESWGPRLSEYLRVSLHTLARTDGATLCELPVLLTDATYRARVIGGLDDPIGLGAVWSQFDSLSEAERSTAISPILNKVRPWLVQARMRHVLGQAEPRLNIDDVMSESRILFVPLSAGELGADAAALLGAVVMAQISQAIMRRVRLPRSERHPVFLVVDEAQMLGSLPTPIPDLLAMARAMGVAVTLANQTLSQFDTELREAVLGTTRSRIIFQLAASDAGRMAKELAPHLGAQDLQGLGPYEVVVTLATGGRVAPPATGKTRPLPPGNGQAAAVREQSRQRWGRDRDEVEAELRRRQERPTASGAVGRQRRSR